MATPNWQHQTIWTADNLDIMRGMNSESVDLIYLDPPFNSNANYAAPIGSQAAGAEFKDTWGLNDINLAWHGLIKSEYPGLYDLLTAVRTVHGASMMSYLIYMAIRIMEMRRILKETGSIYLHCDPTASHYLKLLMDTVFGKDHFQNEIIWQRYDRPKGSQHKARRYGRSSDTILFYSKGRRHTFNADEIRTPLSQDEIDKRFSSIDDKGRFMSGPLLRSPSMGDRPNLVFEFQGYTPGPFGWRMTRENLQNIYDRDDFYFTSNGVPRRKFRSGQYLGDIIDNVWTDIDALGSQDQERLGYPTQKPLALLKRIILASSHPGSMVLDPFCGCATACIAAEMDGRQWVGIDISAKAADLVKSRMHDELGLFYNGVHRTDVPMRTDLGQVQKYNSPENKKHLYGEQGGYCLGCETHFQPQHLTVDHIIPRSKGGTDHISNLQLLCGSCNSTKGTGTQEELLVKLTDKGWIKKKAA